MSINIEYWTVYVKYTWFRKYIKLTEVRISMRLKYRSKTKKNILK